MVKTGRSRISRIEVDGLFHRYRHTVELNPQERVTILFGPNGIGKTALLRLVFGLFSSRFLEFKRFPFKRFEVTLTNKEGVRIDAVWPAAKAGNPEKAGTTFTLSHIRANSVVEHEPLKLAPPDALMWLDRLEGDLWRRIDESHWVDHRAGDVVTTDELYLRYSDADIFPPSVREQMKQRVPNWYTMFREAVRVHFIDTHRLRATAPLEPSRRTRSSHPLSSPAGQAAVAEIARELQQRAKDTLERYARKSQTLDQTFPQRLMASFSPVDSSELLKEKLTALNEKRRKYMGIGLLTENLESTFDVERLVNLPSEHNQVLTLYSKDTEEKLAVFDDLAGRIEQLITSINRKFSYTGKSIRLDQDLTLIACRHDGNSLPLEALSSGEQHEIVVLYHLLFRVEPNTLVLFDEPELSLHVSWQKEFLPELLGIAEAASFDALLATHSPFIIGDRNDLAVEMSAGKS